MNPEAVEALRAIIAQVPVVYLGTAPILCMNAGVDHGRFWFVDDADKMHVLPDVEPELLYGGKHVRLGDSSVLPLADADDVDNADALATWQPRYFDTEPGLSFIRNQLEILRQNGTL